MQKNNFFKKSTLFVIVLILGLSISCKQKATKPDIKIVDFTQTLDSLSIILCNKINQCLRQ